MNNCVSSNLKPAITNRAVIITIQEMVIMKKTRLRAMLPVGEPEGKMHHPVGPKRATHDEKLR